MVRRMTDKEFWDGVRRIYQDEELGVLDSLGETSMLAMFETKRFGDRREYLMSKAERSKLDNLDDVITIYRGIGTDDDIDFDKYGYGFSWSQSEKVATWFATRFLRARRLVIEARIKKEHIIALLTDKDEAEVVVNPKEIIIINEREV